MAQKRRLRIPPPVALKQIDGSIVCHENDPARPVIRTFREFVFDRTIDMLFVTADKDATPQTHPFDANCLFDQHAVLEAVSGEPGTDASISDDVWQRLQRSVKGCCYNANVAYLFRDHVLAVMNAQLES